MSSCGASEGYILLKRRQPVELDHKLFASELGVELFSEEGFDSYDQALVYPEGSEECVELGVRAMALREKLRGQGDLSTLTGYIYGGVWGENYLSAVRTTIGQMQRVSKELDPQKNHHVAVVMQAAAVFGVGLSECLGIVFRQRLQPKKKEDLSNALRYLIWGGREFYEYASRLRADLLEAKGRPAGGAEALSLPEWEGFLQLARNLLEHPALSFRVPQVLNLYSLGQRVEDFVIEKPRQLPGQRQEILLLLKFSLLVVDYFCKAARVPVDIRKRLERELVREQSKLLHASVEIRNMTTPEGVYENLPTEQTALFKEEADGSTGMKKRQKENKA